MRDRRHVVFLLSGLASLTIAVTGCGGTTEGARPGQTTVVAAFYPLAWVAQRVGGTSVHVTDLTPPGAEPHDVELTPQDVQEIRDADLVLYLGHGFQPSVEKAVESRTGPSLDLLAGQRFSPVRRVARLSTRTSGSTRSGSRRWRQRSAARSAGPRWLPHSPVVSIASTRAWRPVSPRAVADEIVTSHAAFGYLARRYDLDQVALGGLTPEAEPRPRDLARLIHEVERTHATTVFFEPLVSSRIADTIARNAGVKTAELDPLEGLTSHEAAEGEDYVSIMGREPRRAPGGARMPLAVELRDVTFGYRPGQPVLEEVSLRIGEGEFVAIAGPNGGGKTTLVKLIVGLERPTTGRRVSSASLRSASRAGASSAISPSGPSSGAMCPRRYVRPSPRAGCRAGSSGRSGSGIASSSAMRSRASAWATWPTRRSGRSRGDMQQRAFIAKALAGEPSLLVLDEPTTGVDAESQESLAGLLDELHSELGVTILYVSHEFGAVERFVQRLLLVRRTIVFDGSPDDLPGVWHDPSHTHASA